MLASRRSERARSGLLSFGFGGYQIEYTIVVKRNDCEMLMPQNRQMRVIAV